ARCCSIAAMTVGSFADRRSAPKNRCLQLSNRERAAAFAPELSVLPSLPSTTPVSSSAFSRPRWMIAYREEAVMRRSAA
ncbi:hypothetical protein, partial [Halomonas sp. ND22Bw]|uniref:hypothetical protein n=1 Tax=Halomonas sp. ND22Bw TaxID=2054178 RepID=UPI001C62BBA9